MEALDACELVLGNVFMASIFKMVHVTLSWKGLDASHHTRLFHFHPLDLHAIATLGLGTIRHRHPASTTGGITKECAV